MKKINILKPIGYCLIASIMIGCSDSPRKAEYKKSTSLPTLEMPPDLISPETEDALFVPESKVKDSVTFSDYSKEQATEKEGTIHFADSTKEIGVLPLSDVVQVKRAGSHRWLEIQANPEVVWDKVKKFWQAEGFLLTRDNPKIGILETEWKENKADIPQDGIRKYLGKVLDFAYDASTRDKFKVRLERGTTPDTTELYLTHQGAQEVAKNDTFVWQNRPADPELEVEMLNRFVVFLGMNQNQADSLLAETSENAESFSQLMHTKEGQFSLLIHDEFERTWRRIGLGLERIGCTIEDHDREEGMYLVIYKKQTEEEDGILSKFFKRKKNSQNQKFLVGLVEEKQDTRVVVLSKNEENQTIIAKEILTALYEQMR